MRTLSRLLAVPSLIGALQLAEPAYAQDCSSTPAVTCTGGNQVDTTFGEPPTSATCFGCPLGTQNGTWSATSTGYHAIQVPKFQLQPGVCGSLIQADITFQYSARVRARAENLDDKPQPVSVNMNLNSEVFAPPGLGLGQIIIPNSNVAANPTLGAFDGTIDFCGPTGTNCGTSGYDQTFENTVSRCFRITNPAQLAAFTAGAPGEQIVFNHVSTDGSSVIGPGNLATIVNTWALLRVTITYRSCVCQTIAADDNARVCVGSSVSVPILANDSTTCGLLDPASVVIVGTPPTGFSVSGTNVVFNANGIAPGTYVATYRVCNDQVPPCCDEGLVTITVCETTANNDTGRVCAGSSVTVNALANDTTTCGTLNPASLAFVGTPPPGFSIAGGQIVYTNPGSPSSGTVTATYQVCNSLAIPCCDTATVTITICNTNAVDDTARVCAGASVTTNVLANDTTNCGSIVPGTLAFVGTPPPGFTIVGGQIVYTNPGSPSSGTVSATYRVCNNETPPCCDTATLTVTICSTNAVDDTARVCAGSSVTMNVLANDTTNCGSIVPGSLAFVGTPPPGFAIVGGQIQYTNPGTPSSGTVTATYRVCNNETPPCCDTATLTVTICSTNAVDDTARVCAGSSVTTNVLGNDTTNCGSIVPGSLAFVGTPPPGFSIVGGQIQYSNPGTPSSGTVTATYRVCNNETPPCCDTATLTVTICSTNAVDDTALICAGTTVSIPVLANDTTNCGSLVPASLAFVGTPPPGFSIAGGQIVYANPGTPSSGTVMATYRVCNDETPPCCDTAVLTVTICAVNAVDDPLTICCGETTSVNVLENDITSCGRLSCDQVELVKPYPPGFSVSGCIVTYDSSLGNCPPTATARYRIRGGTGLICADEADVIVTIRSTPLAVDDRIDLLPTTTFPLDIDVLANDSPGKGCTFPACTGCQAMPPTAPCAVTIVTNPLFGTATVQPDCTVRYEPGKMFSTGDRFCYEVTNSCGCTAQACVTIASCREVDRNTCGSLLLFPEYDNRQQSQTLFSITNGCCDIQDGDIWVEFRFIDALTCQETDYTLRLTPCDTVTFLTSTVNPNSTRGYAYAFAKRVTPGPGNPGGMPIVRNKLIGQALIVDGLEDVEYAMNAVSFLGIGPELADNDDDGDGIRDLNGPLTALGEYEQAPDEILIPRFLGQDPPGTNAQFQSDLVILGLSGGSSFTTLVQFLVYNDSEDVTSQTASFYCWDKRPLVQWAPATLASVLDDQGDDPDEILGAPTKMAGWIRLDGLSAFSSQEEITDPAIYAVLIEKYAVDSVADLPFEKCSQANGDLLPNGPFGDGPVPVAGDGQ